MTTPAKVACKKLFIWGRGEGWQKSGANRKRESFNHITFTPRDTCDINFRVRNWFSIEVELKCAVCCSVIKAGSLSRLLNRAATFFSAKHCRRLFIQRRQTASKQNQNVNSYWRQSRAGFIFLSNLVHECSSSELFFCFPPSTRTDQKAEHKKISSLCVLNGKCYLGSAPRHKKVVFHLFGKLFLHHRKMIFFLPREMGKQRGKEPPVCVCRV